jgi:hypothetical protein
MKKLLLFTFTLCIGFSSIAQKKSSALYDRAIHPVKMDYSFTKKQSENTPTSIHLKSGNAALIDRTDLGVSANVFSVLLPYQRCLSYDEASNILLATYRADPATYPGALASGTLIAHTSSDNGMSWNHMIHLNPDPSVIGQRYPSGVLYNENSSSNPSDLYAVVGGPGTDGTNWVQTYFGSKKLTEENETALYEDLLSPNQWDTYSMTVVPNGIHFFGRDFETAGTNQGVNQTIRHMYGTTNDPADGFDWELNTITPDWFVDQDGIAIALYNSWSAWSRDGSIGYAWMIGVTNDSEEYGGYQPQVFFTEDSGDNWDEIELNMEDHPTLVQYLPPWEDADGNPQTVKPTMGIAEGGSRNFPGVVDYQGNLHIFAPTFGQSTQSAADPNSGYWNPETSRGGYIFDIVLNADGLQDIIFVDSIVSAKTPVDFWGGNPAVDWDHRLQASKTLDEKVVFAVWADDSDSPTGVLDNPDIKAWANYVEAGQQSEPLNFTQDDLYAGFFFFHFVSELTPLIGGYYKIPIAITLSPTEFANGNSTAPCSHFFLDGIEFLAIESVDENLNISKENISISQNQPNPFTGYTTIEISSKTAAPVLVEVTNIMGQRVYTVNAGTINGTKRVDLDASNLDAGVYFYTVTIGNERVSKKMIVE